MKQLDEIINGSGDISTWKTFDHHNCRFGKWYYSDGIEDDGSLPEFREMEVSHAAVHKFANDCVAAAHASEKSRAERLLAQAHDASNAVMGKCGTLKRAIEAHAAEALRS